MGRGIVAALRTPAYLSGSRLRELVCFPEERELAANPGDRPRAALLAARYAIAGLGRLPGPWLPTCLYRSIAKCLVLRSYGISARVRMGVRRDEDGCPSTVAEDREGALHEEDLYSLGVAAHSWVEIEGSPSPVEAEGYEPLEFAFLGSSEDRQDACSSMASRPREKKDSLSSTVPSNPSSNPEVGTMLCSRTSWSANRGPVSTATPASRPRLGDETLGWLLPADGRLVLESAPELRHLVEPWVPLTARRLESSSKQVSPTSDQAASVLRVEPAASSRNEPPEEPATLEMESVRAWVRGDSTFLLGGETWGEVDLFTGKADLFVVHGGEKEGAGEEVFWLLSLASALLLGRLGRCLLHAGAIADKEGMVWLVAADGGSGKSTICANFVRAGWGCLSDDHVVLIGDEEGLEVQGWLRPFGLDEAWPSGSPTGRKVRVDLAALGERSTFPTSGRLKGVLVPERGGCVESHVRGKRRPDSREGMSAVASGKKHFAAGPGNTVVEPMRPAEILPVLIRQAGWLVADRQCAPASLRLLERAASLPAYRLRLGHDAFSDCKPLLSAVL